MNLAYDYEGRVTSMTVPGQGSPYQTNTYNGLGTRVKIVDNGYGSGTRKYVRGGAGVTDPVLRMTTGAENSPTWTNYTPGVSERTSGTSKFVHAGIKNTDAQSNSSQAISATREYDAFGNVTSSTGTHTGRFGYGGPYGYQEDEGGLKQLGHRLYDPVCGRFVTNDWSRDGRNWFTYCANNPLVFMDMRGLWKIIIAMNPGAKGHGSHAMIGIWDEDPRHPIQWFGFYSDGTVYTGDKPDEHAKFVEISVDRRQYLGLKKRLFSKVHSAQRGEKDGEYNLLTNNCAQFIWDILAEVGIVSSDERNTIRDPQDLIDALANQGTSYNGAANLPVHIPWTGARPHPKNGGSSGK